MGNLKIFAAEKGWAMTESEAKEFLSKSKSNLLLGTVDEVGDPNIHAVWYYFDPKSVRLYFITTPGSKKARNLQRRKTVYFSVDDNRSYKLRGVRGKGRAGVVTDSAIIPSVTMKLLTRYLKPKHPVTKEYADAVRSGDSVVIEIVPTYLSTWDYRRMSPKELKRQKEAAIPE